MEVKLNEKYKVKVFAQESVGLGVTKIDEMVAFVRNGLPGDEGEVLITEVMKNYVRGEMVSVDVLSSERQDAPCPYFGECGGCDIQHQGYAFQLAFKEHKIRAALEHIGGLKDVLINDIVSGEQFNYRNKITLKVNGDKLGFYKHNTNDITDIEECIISHYKINEAITALRLFIKTHKDNTFDTIMVRYSDGVMISIDGKDDSLSNEIASFLVGKIDNLKSVLLNNVVIYGDDFIKEKIYDMTFKLSPTSFYQVNNEIMKKLYAKVIDYVSYIENDTILDLYCGVGTITSLLSKHAKKVIGIEVESSAIDNANENVVHNNINNVDFIKGKVGYAIKALIKENIDTIVMDPPRMGIDKWTIEAILQMKPKQIVYVSCNPATLARDLKILCNNGYDLNEVTPFDMFPQTCHVETVTLLTNNKQTF